MVNRAHDKGRMAEGKNRAVFLDRDGTINVEKGYVHKIEDFEFIPGVPQAVRLLRDAGFLVIVVTNQSGVARGYYPLGAVHTLHRHMDAELAKHGAAVDAYYICPHHPEGEEQGYSMACGCRKPHPGMLMEAAKDFSIDLASSYMIGDHASDVEAAVRAGCRPVFVTTGHGRDESARVPEGVPRFGSLPEAVRAIVGGIAWENPETKD
ncbi:MAG TPA: D-glycero-beta-D-manno-heptose 1,7-bisphosphate 7-phosphatase [Geobacteraceae bacterium]|nr:D-glycero-beta-D-manno-heptose 1,7-bisphosphate 7-phosphatase [Geobacteraceae bacterium]